MKRTANLTVVFTTLCTSMAKSFHSSESLEDILIEQKIIDYGSKTVATGNKDLVPATSASCAPSRIAPNPFPERSTAQTLTALRASTTIDKSIITNKLGEKKRQIIDDIESSRRLAQTLAMTEAHSNSFFKPLGVDELSRKVRRAVFNHLAYKARGYDVERHCRARFYQREITNPRNDDDLRVPNQVDGTSTWCLCTDAENDPGRSIPR